MQKIIGGLRYDTDTATLVASHDRRNGSGRDEYLYKTKNGRFFIHYVTVGEDRLDKRIYKTEVIEPLNPKLARLRYEAMPTYHVGYAEVFGEGPKDA